MLETIHELSREQLAASGEEQAVRQRHALHLLRSAESGQRGLSGSKQVEWLQQLEREHHNLRAALGWALDSGEGELALRFCAALPDFWRVKGHYREGRAWIERALAAPPQASPSVRAAALEGAGVLAYIQDDPLGARRSIDASVELWRAADRCPRLAFALAYQGMLARHSGDLVTARASCEEAVAIPIAPPHRTGHRLALSVLGHLAESEGDLTTARRLQAESLQAAREATPMDVALQLNNVGIVSLRAGAISEAAAAYREALQRSRESAFGEIIAAPLEGLAGVAAAQGRARQAAELLGAATALRAESGGPLIAQFAEEYERIASIAREALGEAAFAAATAAGAATPLAEMIALALATDDQAESPAVQDALPVSASGSDLRPERPLPAPPDGLTARQIDYLRLLAQGQTNKAIAASLVVSEPAVETMLVRLYEKIGAHNRAEAIRYAYEHGLTAPPSP
jgi:non-specific serine/threonine protein kinase